MIVVGTTTVLKAAVAACIGTLAIHSGRNMIQTYNIANNNKQKTISSGQRIPKTVQDLQSIQRKELLQLYFQHCIAPEDINILEGEWNGKLLNNNGLTRITRFITNQLFGKRRLWNGKQFDIKRRKGWNRFDKYKDEKDPRGNKNTRIITLSTENDRSFKLAMEPSRLDKDAWSLILNYNNNNKDDDDEKDITSILWKSMVDEIRVLPTNNTDDGCTILLGLGSMGWSGGMLNSQPFCLYRT